MNDLFRINPYFIKVYFRSETGKEYFGNGVKSIKNDRVILNPFKVTEDCVLEFVRLNCGDMNILYPILYYGGPIALERGNTFDFEFPI